MALKINIIGSTKSGMVEESVINEAIPSGYLLCDGSEVLKTTYPQLFAVCGSIYGVAVDPNKFKLPDFRGVFLRGFDDGRGIDAGRVLGSFQSDELLQHMHRVKYPSGALIQSGGSFALVAFAAITDATGGPETRPRNIAVNYIIKT